MKLMTTLLWIIAILALSGCDIPHKEMAHDRLNQAIVAQDQGQQPAQASLASTPAAAAQVAKASGGGGGGRGDADAQVLQIPLANPVAVQAAAALTDRKIIRNAELAIELDSPADGQRKIAAIAEAHGGFVVNSEFKQNEGGNQAAANTTVTVVVRVPSAQFSAVVDKIEAIGGHVKREKKSGQDVTEEYIDLEARMRTKRALEAQFLEIMKQARKVSDALEVQSQLADVRTEIERLEGRRRFLENQSALSTITVTLQTPAPVVAATTSGFFHSVKQAFGDSIDLAAEIMLGLIRMVIVLIPILLFIVLPSVWLLRFFSRRYGWFKKQSSPVPQPE